MSRLKKKDSGGRSGSPPWMATFADMMQLLLTFFVLLYSMSNVDVEKFASVTSSIQMQFMNYNGGASSIIEGYEGTQVLPIQEATIVTDEPIVEEISPEVIEMYEKIGSFLIDNELEAEVSVRMNSEGVFVDIKEAILFDSGSARLKDSGLEVLNQLEGLINDFNNDIVIEGHTDNIPITSTMYPTNWELSTSRAVSVVRFLSEVEGVDPSRLSARGYGEHSPIAPNDTQENRALNRRVNMFIVFDEEGGN